MTRLLLLLALTACSSHPAVTARDAYQGARVACEAYQLVPAEERQPEVEQACAELESLCEAP